MARPKSSFGAFISLALAWAAARGAHAYDLFLWSPPPPPPPPPPPFTLPPTACDVCLRWAWHTPPAPFNFPPVSFFDTPPGGSFCDFIHTMVSVFFDDVMADLAERGDVSSPLLRSATSTVTCSPREFRFCATFASEDDALVLDAAVLSWLVPALSGLFSDSICPKTIAGHSFSVTMEPGSCLVLNETTLCPPAADPFPNCRCNKTRGITPLYVEPRANKQPGRNDARTNLYCFTIAEVPKRDSVNSTCSSATLAKAEIWADYSKRRNLTALRVTPKGGAPRWLSPTWAGPSDNVLKATPLNWTMEEAIGGEICLELRLGVSLEKDFCKGNACFISLFNDKRDCCPAYASSLPIEEVPFPM